MEERNEKQKEGEEPQNQKEEWTGGCNWILMLPIDQQEVFCVETKDESPGPGNPAIKSNVPLL